MHKRILQAVTVLMTAALLITGCASEASNIGLAKDKESAAIDTGFTVTTVGSYDSADTAVVMSVDQDNKSVCFLNMDTGKQYTLYYDGTTYIKDKYDGPMTISQLKAGDVVDVNFLKGKRKIASIQLSPSAWVYDNIKNYDLGGINKTASIGSSTYSLPDNVVVLSEGKRTEVMDVVAQDVVTISGIDHQIYSINVEKGHGYLRLKNDQALIGGWIEVGSSVIKQITEDMLLVVPEGSYQVLLSNNGITCTKDVVIERDKEVVLDVSDLEISTNKTGKIIFNVTPDSAEVTIDGSPVDISKVVELSYGIHQVHLEAEGYDSLTKYIQVGSEKASISFTLEKSKETDSSDSISQNSLEDDTADDTSSISENTLSATSGNKVYIDSPEDVEVYLDSNYMGLSPVSFKKVTGSHTITLRKSGYVTKSYTIYLYNDGEDITYSFTDLEKETTSSVSDNDLDDEDDDEEDEDEDTTSGDSTDGDTSGNGEDSEDTGTGGTTGSDNNQTEEPDDEEDETGGSGGDGNADDETGDSGNDDGAGDANTGSETEDDDNTSGKENGDAGNPTGNDETDNGVTIPDDTAENNVMQTTTTGNSVSSFMSNIFSRIRSIF